MDYINAYHTTNKSCLKSMINSGFIGLNQKDYDKIKDEIISLFTLSDKQIKYIKNKYFNLSKTFKEEFHMYQGGVSFFPYLDSCKRIKIYGKIGGEYLGLEVVNILKSIARMTNIKYKNLSLKDKILEKYCGIGSDIVVLHFIIPINKFVNFNFQDYENGCEIYTSEKVSMKYFMDYTLI